jgi:hypothetical protein
MSERDEPTPRVPPHVPLTDAERVDWLEVDLDRLEDVILLVSKDKITVRVAIDRLARWLP